MTVGSEAFVNFPGIPLGSLEEFQHYRGLHQSVFDDRYRLEESLGTTAPSLTLPGTCGPCLRVSAFTSSTDSGENTSDGRRVPHWRMAQACDCAHGLTSTERAVLHLALTQAGPPEGLRIGLLGRGERLAAWLAEAGGAVALWPQLARDAGGALALPATPLPQHVILAADELVHVPALDQALAALAAGLMEGGLLVATTAFDIEAAATVTHLPPPEAGGLLPAFTGSQVHRLGWDILPRLRAAGFSDAKVICYWSAEFGYLGTYNVIILASR